MEKGGFMISGKGFRIMLTGLLLSVFAVSGFGRDCDSTCAANVNILSKSDLGIGVGWVDMKPLNDRLSSYGLSNFRANGLSLDLEHQTVINRMMMGGEIKGLFFNNRLTGNTMTSFTAGEILLKSGFNVISTEHINLYPYLGLGAGLMNFVIGDKNTPFDSALARPNMNVNLYQARFLIDLGVGLDLLGGQNASRLGLVGLRAGYTFDPTKTDRWMRDGLWVTDTPKPTLNGAYVMLTIGGAERKSLDMKEWKRHHEGMHKDQGE
jgi:hypothetical protein